MPVTQLDTDQVIDSGSVVLGPGYTEARLSFRGADVILDFGQAKGGVPLNAQAQPGHPLRIVFTGEWSNPVGTGVIFPIKSPTGELIKLILSITGIEQGKYRTVNYTAVPD